MNTNTIFPPPVKWSPKNEHGTTKRLEVLKASLKKKEALLGMLAIDQENHQRGHDDDDVCKEVQTARAAQSPTPAATNEVTVLPDGSAFAVYSYPLPKGHWLYAPREYEQGAEEPKELATPILTHEAREQVVSAIRYAVRAATDCGKETDFDPDTLVLNAVYALCGPAIKSSYCAV